MAGNALEPKKLRSYIEKIERVHGELETMHAEYMADCKEKREDIRQIIKDAKDDGIMTKPLKAQIKKREMMRKINLVTSGLDVDEISQFEQMTLAFDDTPLAKAAARGNGGAEARR